MRFLYGILLTCLVCGSGFIVNAQDSQETRPKIVYIKALSSPQEQTLYVGQEVSVTYEISLFAGATLKDTSFERIARDRIEIVNKNVGWKNVDGRMQATYVFKLKAASATIPVLNVKALSADGSYEEIASAGAITLQAIDLRSNVRYAGVLGKNFKVLRSKSENYDLENNIVIFEFEVQSLNAKDMSINGFQTQGFEEIKEQDNLTYGIYYVVVPKTMRDFSFDYFNLESRRFENITIPVVVTGVELVSTQSDLNPKVSYTLFKLVALGLLIAVFLGLFIWKRYKIFLFIVALLCGALVYSLMFNNVYGMLKSGASISILPMRHSTIVKIIEDDTPVQIMDRRGVDIDGQGVLFYKVLIGDSQIGWVRSEYVLKD